MRGIYPAREFYASCGLRPSREPDSTHPGWVSPALEDAPQASGARRMQGPVGWAERNWTACREAVGRGTGRRWRAPAGNTMGQTFRRPVTFLTLTGGNAASATWVSAATRP